MLNNNLLAVQWNGMCSAVRAGAIKQWWVVA